LVERGLWAVGEEVWGGRRMGTKGGGEEVRQVLEEVSVGKGWRAGHGQPECTDTEAPERGGWRGECQDGDGCEGLTDGCVMCSLVLIGTRSPLRRRLGRSVGVTPAGRWWARVRGKS